MRTSVETMARRVTRLTVVAVSASMWVMCSCAKNGSAAATGEPSERVVVPLPAPTDASPRDFPGIHNAVAYHEGFVSGSVPEGDAGFDTLAAMGVKTIISVDGAAPEVEPARARGMRYIHLPIGYNGFDEERKLELVRATRDAMAEGPVYIHCHHGKHRSAGAAACIAASLGWETPEEAVERMRVSGTAPNYKGLFAVAAGASVLSSSAIDSVPGEFPEVSRPTGFVHGMVEMDVANDALKAIEKAGWGAPTDHPDLVPVAEAGRLADLLRTLEPLEYTRRRPAEFGVLLQDAQARAQALEDILAQPSVDRAKASAQFALVAASCKDCHARHRDEVAPE